MIWKMTKRYVVNVPLRLISCIPEKQKLSVTVTRTKVFFNSAEDFFSVSLLI